MENANNFPVFPFSMHILTKMCISLLYYGYFPIIKEKNFFLLSFGK